MKKIRITHDGSMSIARGTRVLDAETGEELQWVRRVECILDASGVPEAILYVTAPELEITIEAEIRENERAQEERIAEAVVARLKNFITRQFTPRLTQ